MRGRGPMLGCKLKPESIHNNTRLIWHVTWPLQWCPFVGQAFPGKLWTPCISLIKISYYGHVLNFRLRKSHGPLCDLRHQACERGGKAVIMPITPVINYHTAYIGCRINYINWACCIDRAFYPDVGLIISGFKRENILHKLVPWYHGRALGYG